MDLRELAEINVRFSSAEPEEIVDYAVERFGPYLVMGTGCSPNSGVLLHLVHTRHPWIPAVFVNPGDVPASNFRYQQELKRKMPDLVFETYEMATPLTEDDWRLLAEGGQQRQSVYERRKLPLIKQALDRHQAQAILYGARFDQSTIRARFPLFRPNTEGVIRIYPSLFRDERHAVEYLTCNNLPIHEEGLPGGERLECGIHL